MIVKLQNMESDNRQASSTQGNSKQDDRVREKKSQSVDASNLNLNQDNVLMKRIQAQKSALKTVLDAFAGEQASDNSIIEHLRKSSDLTQEANDNLAEINRLKGLKSELKDTYQVEDDSQEQQDLELLEKQQRIKQVKSGEVLTEEEKKRLAQMGPQTEYQSAALAYDSYINEYQTRVDKAKIRASIENRTVDAIKIEQVKTHTMVDAEKTADQIMEQASNEIIGLVVGDAKDHIDEELEKTKEEAEKKAEEEKEEKAKLEKKKQEDEIGETTKRLSEITQADNAQDKFQKEVKIMIDNQKLLEEDIKGLAVDEQI